MKTSPEVKKMLLLWEEACGILKPQHHGSTSGLSGPGSGYEVSRGKT